MPIYWRLKGSSVSGSIGQITYIQTHRISQQPPIFSIVYMCETKKCICAVVPVILYLLIFFLSHSTRIHTYTARTMAFKHMQNTEVYYNRIRLTLTLCASVLYACTSERNRYRFDTEQRAISFTSSTLTNGLLCYYYYICCFCYFIHRRFFLLFYSVLFSVRFPFTFIFLLHHRIGLCVKLLK